MYFYLYMCIYSVFMFLLSLGTLHIAGPREFTALANILRTSGWSDGNEI